MFSFKNKKRDSENHSTFAFVYGSIHPKDNIDLNLLQLKMFFQHFGVPNKCGMTTKIIQDLCMK